MATLFYVCSIMVCVLCVHAMQSFKVLYCQDPDTGILHPVNTTWPSKSFCGNYTCKVRRKNLSSEDIPSLKKINITNININFLKSEEDMSHGASQHIGMKLSPGMTHLLHRERYGNEKEQKQIPVNTSKDDGYLTEAEIKVISDMLHTVKKSDLEAIVEIYNLAQDIYKDVDQHQTEPLYQDAMTPIRTHDPISQEFGNKDKQTSYWYEPLHFHSAKVKSGTNTKSDATTSANTIQSTAASNRDSYFSGSLTEKDFRKLPYYYPANLQRAPSYSPSVKQNEPHVKAEVKPCKKPSTSTSNTYGLPPWINNSLRKHYASGTHHKCLEPSLLLPYPFAYVNNNLSGYSPNVYYNAYSGYPWPQVNRNYQQSYAGTAYASHVPSESVFVKPLTGEEIELQPNSITKEDIIDIISNLKDKEANKMPDWQTASLPEKVIEEVRGNAEKSRIVKTPLRRKIRLERVDKVIKIDETLRPKRSVVEFRSNFGKADEFETYLTKITCEPSTELGFFRRGNMSKLFPACCPVRIEE